MEAQFFLIFIRVDLGFFLFVRLLLDLDEPLVEEIGGVGARVHGPIHALLFVASSPVQPLVRRSAIGHGAALRTTLKLLYISLWCAGPQ